MDTWIQARVPCILVMAFLIRAGHSNNLLTAHYSILKAHFCCVLQTKCAASLPGHSLSGLAIVISCFLENADMSVDLLRLKSGTSESNSRAIESIVRALMTSEFADLDMHFDVERSSRTNIVLVPTYDEPVADFERHFELLKDQLAADPRILLYVNLSTMLDMADSDSSSDDGSDIDQHIQSRDWRFTPGGNFIPTKTDRSTPQPAVAYQVPVRSRYWEHSWSLWESRNNGRDTETPGPRAVCTHTVPNGRELRRQRTVLKCG